MLANHIYSNVKTSDVSVGVKSRSRLTPS